MQCFIVCFINLVSLVECQSIVIINKNILFGLLTFYEGRKILAVGQLIHLLVQCLTLKTLLLVDSLIQLDLLMQS